MAETRRNKQHLNEIISILPDDLLLTILEKVPLSDAVRTSCLSHRWKNVWKFISIINLGPCSNESIWKEIVSFLDNFLVFYRGQKIKQFSDKLTYHPEMAVHIDSWVLFASKNFVEELCLDLNEEEEEAAIIEDYPFYMLNPCVFDCKTLVSLKLVFCQLKLPPMVELHFLREVDFYCVELPQDFICTLTSGTPILKYMYLKECNPTTDLDIDVVPNPNFCKLHIHERSSDGSDRTQLKLNAPNAQEILFIGDMSRSNYIVKNMIKCATAFISMDDMFLACEDNVGKGHYFLASNSDALNYETMIQQILGGFKDLNSLSMCTWCLQLFGLQELRNFNNELRDLRNLNNRLTFRCTSLELDMCYEIEDVIGHFYMLQASHMLEDLVLKISIIINTIKVGQEYGQQLRAQKHLYWEKVKKNISLWLNNLRSLKFSHYTENYKTWEDGCFDEKKFFGTLHIGIAILNIFKSKAKNLRHVIFSTEEKEYVLNLKGDETDVFCFSFSVNLSTHMRIL